MNVRSLSVESDLAQLRECVIELQDHERGIDPRMPCGESIADAYIDDLLDKCRRYDGDILVAEVDDALVGYVAVLASVVSEDIDDGGLTYALIDDLLVRKTFQGRGYGKTLLRAAQTYAKSRGASWLRLSVLAQNNGARRVYEAMAFEPLYIDYEKRIS